MKVLEHKKTLIILGVIFFISKNQIFNFYDILTKSIASLALLSLVWQTSIIGKKYFNKKISKRTLGEALSAHFFRTVNITLFLLNIYIIIIYSFTFSSLDQTYVSEVSHVIHLRKGRCICVYEMDGIEGHFNTARSFDHTKFVSGMPIYIEYKESILGKKIITHIEY